MKRRRTKHQRKRPGWVMNREFFIAGDEGVRRADIRRPEDRAAIRDYLMHAERHSVRRRAAHG